MFTNVLNKIRFSPDADGNSGTSEISSENGTETPENSSAQSEEEFEKLIKGKYADAFSKRTQSIIDKRFAKMKVYEKKMSDAQPLFDALSEGYPDIENGDIPALVSAFLTDREKNERTKTEEASKKELLVRAEEEAQRQAAERITAKWEQDAAELKNVYPSFSLEKAIQEDKNFGLLLKAGVPVRLAHEAANLEKIMGSAMKYAAEAAGRKTAAALSGNSGRVQENSVLGRASSVTRKDVSSLTENDIMKIIHEVGKGAKISF